MCHSWCWTCASFPRRIKSFVPRGGYFRLWLKWIYANMMMITVMITAISLEDRYATQYRTIDMLFSGLALATYSRHKFLLPFQLLHNHEYFQTYILLYIATTHIKRCRQMLLFCPRCWSSTWFLESFVIFLGWWKEKRRKEERREGAQKCWDVICAERQLHEIMTISLRLQCFQAKDRVLQLLKC